MARRADPGTGYGRPRLPQLLRDLAADREPGPGHQLDGEILAIASEHRMLGLLWSWVRHHEVDPALRAKLAIWDLSTQAHLERVTSTLLGALEVLEKADLEVAAVKGVTAESRWYRRRGERPCADVDLLLAPHHRHRAHEVVATLQPDHPWNGPHLQRMLSSRGVQAVTMNPSGIEIDLHLDLLKIGVPHRASAEIWSRTVQEQVAGVHLVRVLDETSALVHLLVHLNKDRFQRLLGFADVPRVMATGNVDWDRFLSLVARDGLEVPVLQSLEVVLDELELDRPVGLPRPTGARSRLWKVLWRPDLRLRGREGRLRFRRRQQWIALLARGRLREAAWSTLADAWPPRAAVSVRYGHIRGPYLWKLIQGRVEAFRAQRREVSRVRDRRRELAGPS